MIETNIKSIVWVAPAPGGFKWEVKWGTRAGIEFESRGDAIEFAREMVHREEEGAFKEIRVKKPDGSHDVEWAHEKDPYPPAIL